MTVIGSRFGVPPKTLQRAAFDELCTAADARHLDDLGPDSQKLYRDNVLPRAYHVALHKLSDWSTVNTRAIVRCAALGLADRIEQRIPDMVRLGYFPVQRIQRYVPSDTSAWRRFAALCEECGSSWDDIERNGKGTTLCTFTESEMAELDRAASAYGISRQRFVTLGVIHLIRTWEVRTGEHQVEPRDAGNDPEVGGRLLSPGDRSGACEGQ